MCFNKVQYFYVGNDRDCCISLHPLLHEVIAAFDPPSFKKCDHFIWRLGQEYIANVDEQIHYRDLLNLTKSVFGNVEIDDTALAFELLKNVLTYSDKYMYYNAMCDMLDIMAALLENDDQHPTEAAIYEYFRGIISLGVDDIGECVRHFEKGIHILKPSDTATAVLATKLYGALSFFYLASEPEKAHDYLEKASRIQVEYGLTNPLDCEMNHLFSGFAKAQMNAKDAPLDLDTLFKIPEMAPFIDLCRQQAPQKVRKEEYQRDIDHLVPEELPPDAANIFQFLKDNLSDYAAGVSDEVPLIELIFGTIETTFKTVSENPSSIFAVLNGDSNE